MIPVYDAMLMKEADGIQESAARRAVNFLALLHESKAA